MITSLTENLFYKVRGFYPKKNDRYFYKKETKGGKKKIWARFE